MRIRQLRPALSALALALLLVIGAWRAKAYTYWVVENLSQSNWSSNWNLVGTAGSGANTYYALAQQSYGSYTGVQGSSYNGYNFCGAAWSTSSQEAGQISLTVELGENLTNAGSILFNGSSPSAPFPYSGSSAYYNELDYSLNGSSGTIYLTLNQGGSSTNVGSAAFSLQATNAHTIALFANGSSEGVYLDGNLVLTLAGSSASGYYGFGSCDTTPGDLITNISAGPIGGYPQAISSSQIGVSAYSNAVDLQWPAASDSDPQVPIYEYQIYRNGSLLATTHSLTYSDTTVSPQTTYTYTLTIEDVFLNTASTNISATTPAVAPPQTPSNPPYPSTTPDGRRVGVRPTGAYWGASGENIDVLTGNLSFSQPLLNAQSRGWSANFNLIYNSQNWRQDSGGIWEFNGDTGFGYGWRLMPGAIEPVYINNGTTLSYYIYIDSTGAEYSLNQQNGNIWSSSQSAYVWWDSYASVLHFRDGSFWYFLCVSASNQADAGFMYPTLMEDTNGNQILISYMTAPGSAWANSSSRITYIADVRATDPEGIYYTYAFSYNTDSPPHLTSITNSIGTGEAYTFSYSATQTLQDPFQNGAHGTTKFLQTLALTNIGTNYEFTTDAYGELTQIQLPYKGTLGYTYTTTQYADQRTFREIINRSLSTCNSAGQGCESGSGQYTISHESSPGYDVHEYTLIEDPGGVGEKYWAFNSNGTYEGLASTYQGRDRSAGGPGNCLSGSSTGLGACKTEIDYTYSQDSNGNSYLGLWYTTLDPGQSYGIQTSAAQQLDIYGNLTADSYNQYSSLGGGWVQHGYSYLNSSNYTSRYIDNRLTSAAIRNSNNAFATLATITYDCGSACVGAGYSPSPRQWDTNYASIGYRGNPTTTATLSGNSTTVYDMYGNATSGSDNNGVSSTSTMTSSTNYAAPSVFTVAGSLSTNLTYASAGFLGLTNATGPNGTTVDIGYDANARPTSSMSPFGATTNTYYNDTASPPNSCTIVDGRWTQTNLDGLGRPILTLTGSGSGCGQSPLTQAETTYAPCGCTPIGKMVSQAVPHAYGTQPSATTTYTYDGVGRTLSKAVVGSETQGTTSYVYQGNTITAYDPAGAWKKYTTDAFGNLVQVEEPNGSPSTPGNPSNYITTYTYDLFNHLVGVSMSRSTGTQTRSWSYNGVFLASATNPENGTITYAYGSNKKVSQRTDAKGQATTYAYDSQARLTQVQHYPNGINNAADPCQTVNYYYDGYNPLGPQNPLALGHLSAIQYYSSVSVPSANPNPSCDTTFTEIYTYGGAGAPIGKQLTVTRNYEYQEDEENIFQNFNINLNATYTYDGEGRVINLTYPTDSSGNTANLSYTFDSMGRLYSMTDNIANQQIIQEALYGPANEMTYLEGGNYFGARASETRSYNSLKQLTSIYAYGAIETSYGYPSTDNNGKIASQNDAISGETVTYTYDTLNRLASANNSGASPSWGQSFAYDGFGNLTQTSVTQGSAPTFGASYNSNNRVGNEDANGNPPQVPLPAYGIPAWATFDVENRLEQLSTGEGPAINYAYDPANHRVWRYNPNNSPTTDEITFWSITGQKLGTYQLTYNAGNGGCCYGEGNYQAPQFTVAQTDINLYFGAKLIKNKTGWVYPDRLGSIGKFYPYGIERPSATTNDTEKFTGYFRDAESGNDYAVNRYQSPGYGRFLTPDTVDGSPTDPGSWNKYAYVEGDPINRTDPNGKDWCGYGVAGSAYEAGDGSCDGIGPDPLGNCYIFNAMGMLEVQDVDGCTNVVWGEPGTFSGAGNTYSPTAAALQNLENLGYIGAWSIDPTTGLINLTQVNWDQVFSSFAAGDLTWPTAGGSFWDAVLTAINKVPMLAVLGMALGEVGSTPPPNFWAKQRCNELVNSGNYNNPTQAPGAGWIWKGNGPVGSPQGSWYNPTTGEVWYPDLNHPPGVAPHWDYKDPNGVWWRCFADGTVVKK